MTDFNINFDAHPVTGDISIVDDIESIRQSIRNLIQTAFYEVPFWPNIGSQIANALFENYSQTLTEYTITKSIQNVIRYQEPRARDVRIEVDFRAGNREIDVIVTFFPVNSSTRQTVRAPLQRVR